MQIYCIYCNYHTLKLHGREMQRETMHTQAVLHQLKVWFLLYHYHYQQDGLTSLDILPKTSLWTRWNRHRAEQIQFSTNSISVFLFTFFMFIFNLLIKHLTVNTRHLKMEPTKMETPGNKSTCFDLELSFSQAQQGSPGVAISGNFALKSAICKIGT